MKKEKTYSIWERFKSNKPSFFKKTQVFGLSLVALSLSLAEIKSIPTLVITVLASSGSAIAAISQFAVKQYEPLESEFDIHKKP